MTPIDGVLEPFTLLCLLLSLFWIIRVDAHAKYNLMMQENFPFPGVQVDKTSKRRKIGQGRVAHSTMEESGDKRG
jgi:hypothetical protein